ncbi:MAG: bacillithiol biosynthesis cysteine-adding enzyme BshC [Bacteroidia bacterium]|nr:bacillithiol biosynthesis cysteine-adding enzyme BshC [Bacteroidia bacterium]
MDIQKIALNQIQAFAPIFVDYLQASPALQPFYGLKPERQSFAEQIALRLATAPGVSSTHRHTLHQVLREQYQSLENPPQNQIDALLAPHTFTVTTGHQLNLFTGPLYFIYKIVTTINLARTLQTQYPNYHFVPLYWMASEDHDFAEINHFHLFNKTLSWESTQTGPVGKFSLEGIETVIEALGESAPLFEQAYRQSSTLAEATRRIVHGLFGSHGLVCLDADHPALKQFLRPIMADDLFSHTAKQLVEQSSQRLDNAGYKTQVFPREINFFYLAPGLRERLVKHPDHYEVLNSPHRFADSEIRELIENTPERFSPNVVLRPLYQELILPNLAYVGGPGELAYWLQLKGVFDHYRVPFPILMPRNFALILNKTNARKYAKLGLTPADLFLDVQELKTHFLARHADTEIQLNQEQEALSALFERVRKKARSVDQSLEGFVGAEENKAIKSLENIEKRLKKAEENNQKTEVDQLVSLKEKLFPEGNLQERYDNLLNFYLNQPELPDILLEQLSAFDFAMHVLIEND